MKSKETGWLKNLLGWGQRQQLNSAEQLYQGAVKMARDPEFFIKFGVNDDVDGRFDALSLVVGLVMRRLKTCGDTGRDLSQQLFDSMFSDMDLTLREMGAGDIGVSKRVRIMAEGFLGRLDAYATALDEGDNDALAEALRRNLIRNDDKMNPVETGLLDYVLAIVADLDRVPDNSLINGTLR
ncbi:ubiquinol-cytochrome C chaperone [Alphaproteobacteria bacterium]|nr:ubiquinol-cytochrome C chaperone [Alphaproteobacteria bacterium]